jgi:hypothetical protein
MPFRPLRPMRGFRVTEPAIQCSTRMDRKPANPERYFSYLQKKFDARGFDIRLCGRGASIEMNGAPLCTQHAGELVLSMLLAGELVFADGSSPIPRQAPVEYADIGDIVITRRPTGEAGDAQ